MFLQIRTSLIGMSLFLLRNLDCDFFVHAGTISLKSFFLYIDQLQQYIWIVGCALIHILLVNEVKSNQLAREEICPLQFHMVKVFLHHPISFLLPLGMVPISSSIQYLKIHVSLQNDVCCELFLCHVNWV